MMRFVLLLPLALMGCDSVPSPIGPVAGAPPRIVELDGSTFSVRHTDSEAVAVRTNFDLRAKRGVILPRAGIAIEQVSGCRVRPGSLAGDVARIEARIDC